MTTRAPLDAGVLILGDGYLAGFLAPLLGSNAVVAVSRSGRAHAASTHGHVVRVAADLFDAAQAVRWQKAVHDHCADGVVVFVLLPPSALGDRALDPAMSGLVRAVNALRPSSIVVASSSGIYDGVDDKLIMPDTVPLARTTRAARLLAIEQHWAAAGAPLCIARLAGLYGPRRVIGLGTLERGDTLPGAADAWLNLIHAQDAAAALREAGCRRLAASLLLSDGHPYRRRDYYAAVAAAAQLPPPRFNPAAARRGGSRRLDPGTSWAALALQPAYPDACVAVTDLVRLTRE